MNRDRRNRLLALLVVVLLAAGLAFAAGVVVTESETTVAATTVTASAGTLTDPGDSVVLVVPGEGRFADRVEERLEARLAEDGYGVAVAQSLEGHQGPVLVVDIVRAAVGPGVVRHSADLGVETYYATDWNATDYERYRESGVVEQRTPARAAVAGSYDITDRTEGVSTRYRGYAADLVVDAVAENFRGPVPR